MYLFIRYINVYLPFFESCNQLNIRITFYYKIMKKDNILDDLGIDADNKKENYDNTIFGIVTLFLIMTNAFLIQGLIASLTQSNSVIDKLYEPSQEEEFFTVPVFIITSLILIWMITPNNTPMKKMFKITSIIGVVIFMLYSFVFMFLSGLKFNH